VRFFCICLTLLSLAPFTTVNANAKPSRLISAASAAALTAVFV